MTTLAWTALLAVLLTAPSALVATHALAPHEPRADLASAQAQPVLAQVTITHGAADGTIRLVVVHEGLATPATLQMEGGDDRSARAVLLQPGTNVLFEERLGAGAHDFVLQSVGVSGMTSLDVADCPGGVLEATMRTLVTGTRLYIEVGEKACLAG